MPLPSDWEEKQQKHRDWLANGACGERLNLAGAYLAGANLAGAYLAGANLAGANLASADLAGSVLDPALPANAAVSQFGRWADEPRYIIGYRTREQIHMGGEPWSDGHHVAPYFSICPLTACHPGIYLCPIHSSEHGVEVRALATDVHQAGTGADVKWRCRECDIASLGTWQMVPANQVELVVKAPALAGK